MCNKLLGRLLRFEDKCYLKQVTLWEITKIKQGRIDMFKGINEN